MPGTPAEMNLTRAEARERARLLQVESYDVRLDLTTSETTFRSETAVRFGCDEPGAAHLHRPRRRVGAGDRAQRGAARPGHRRLRRPHRAARPRRRQHGAGRRGVRVLAHRRGAAPVHRPGRRLGLPLHAARAARRDAGLQLLRPARPQGHLPAHGDRARRTGRSSPTPPPPSRSRCPTGSPAGGSRPTARISTYITALVAGPYHSVRDEYVRADGTHDPARGVLPGLARAVPRPRRDPRGHQAGLRLLRGAVRPPVPVREVRPAVRAGVQRRRDGERRLRDLPGGHGLPQQGHRRVARCAAPTRSCTRWPTCGSATS